MNSLFSLAYQHAVFLSAVLALAYGVLAVQGWQVRSSAAGEQAILERARWLWPCLLAVAAAHTLLLMATLWLPATAPATGATADASVNHSGALRLNLSFAQALSLATCVGVWLFIVESHWLKKSGLGGIDGLRPLALGFPAVAVVLAAWVAPAPVALHSGAALHVLVAIAAHGVALLACGHGVLLLALSRVLKRGTHSEWGWAAILAQHCPPLVVLERLILRLSLWVAGLLAATVALGLLGGVLKFDHKTVLTLASLAAWLAVPWGYQRRGWRGAALLAAVLVATGLLLLAYIGSRFVLQALLHR